MFPEKIQHSVGGVGRAGGLDAIGMGYIVLGHERLFHSIGGKAVSEHPASFPIYADAVKAAHFSHTIQSMKPGALCLGSKKESGKVHETLKGH